MRLTPRESRTIFHQQPMQLMDRSHWWQILPLSSTLIWTSYRPTYSKSWDSGIWQLISSQCSSYENTRYLAEVRFEPTQAWFCNCTNQCACVVLSEIKKYIYVSTYFIDNSNTVKIIRSTSVHYYYIQREKI